MLKYYYLPSTELIYIVNEEEKMVYYGKSYVQLIRMDTDLSTKYDSRFKERLKYMLEIPEHLALLWSICD